MDSRLTRWCDAFLEACWLVAILVTPLFFNIHSERVFEPDKIALLRSIALVMVAIWIVRLIDQQAWRNIGRFRFSNPDAIWHKPFVLPVAGLILVYLLSTIFSINPWVSWSGSYQRLQGTYTTLSYIAFFGIMATTIRRPEQVRRVINTVIAASIPVALYGMVQHFGHDPLPWGGNVQDRVAGSMGNAIFIAGYLIMVIPLTLSRIIDAFNNILGEEKLDAADIIRASVYIFILAIQLLTLYWSGSRGPLIGLAVGLFSFTLVLLVSLRNSRISEGRTGRIYLREALPALLFLAPTLIALLVSKPISNAAGPLVAFGFFFGVVTMSVLAIFVLIAAGRGWKWLWMGWIFLTLLMAGWLLLFNLPAERTARLRDIPVIGGLFDVLDEWRDLPAIGTFGRMLDPSNATGREKSGRVRVLIWEGVLDLITPHEPLQYPDGSTDPFNWLRPILGYGPETMYTAYNKVYPPELATVESRNASPDRSHNETFDSLVITGPVGLLAWQVLYLTVMLFAFRFLGVVRSRRDTWILIGLWMGGALLVSLLAVLVVDPVYLGVAVPVGVILGVVIYLIYHALFGRPGEFSALHPEAQGSPFAPDRLLMNALIAAVLAHYVEIHFGIAISVTRLYFFAFVALMVALGYRQDATAEIEVEPTPEPVPATKSGKRKRHASPTVEPAARTGWQSLWVPALLIILMLGTLGYGFISYAMPPGKTIASSGDLSATEVFRQSLLQNARQDFVDWPFIMLVIILSWSLAWLVFLAEMVKYREFRFSTPSLGLTDKERLSATGVFLALALTGVAARFLIPATTTTIALGLSLGLIGALVCAIVAVLLLARRPSARAIGGMLSVIFMSLAVPILISGAFLPAMLMLVGGAVALWLLWDSRWRQSLLPTAGVLLISLLGGFLAIYIHAFNYKTLLFYRGRGPVDSTITLRVLESVQVGELLTYFYVFLFLITVLLSFAIGWSGLRGGRLPLTVASSAVAFASLAVMLVVALFLVSQTNVRPVQADMIFKRAKPFDDQATRSVGADPVVRRDLWDTAVAIYEAAIDRAPNEDFYDLFLGRAYLERAAITEAPAEQTQLLTQAEGLLLRAQAINPLNTDHTANLARLNTRWYAAIDDTAERTERLNLASRYYEAALTLSPQNSVIRNEYARLILDVMGDCDRALALYDETAAIDPYYGQTHLARADALTLCGNKSGANRDDYYRRAATSLDMALDINPGNVRAWIQLAEIHRQLGQFEDAQIAIENAQAHNDPPAVPTAELDFLAAQITAGMGDTAEARKLAERAMEVAGEPTLTLIKEFLKGLGEE